MNDQLYPPAGSSAVIIQKIQELLQAVQEQVHNQILAFMHEMDMTKAEMAAKAPQILAQVEEQIRNQVQGFWQALTPDKQLAQDNPDDAWQQLMAQQEALIRATMEYIKTVIEGIFRK